MMSGQELAGKAVDVVIDLATGRVPVREAQHRAKVWMNDAAEATGNPKPYPDVTS